MRKFIAFSRVDSCVSVPEKCASDKTRIVLRRDHAGSGTGDAAAAESSNFGEFLHRLFDSSAPKRRTRSAGSEGESVKWPQGRRIQNNVSASETTSETASARRFAPTGVFVVKAQTLGGDTWGFNRGAKGEGAGNLVAETPTTSSDTWSSNPVSSRLRIRSTPQPSRDKNQVVSF